MIPLLLQKRLEVLLQEQQGDILDAFSHRRTGSFRINTLSPSGEAVWNEFSQKGIVTRSFLSQKNMYVFDPQETYAIKGTDAFYTGKIYLQSIASMLPVFLLDPQPGESILDVCAAPGSKTTQMAACMNNQGTITAFEKNQIRFEKLCYTIRLQGASCVETKKGEAQKFLAQEKTRFWDKILLDAPCSSEGRIFLENPKTYQSWSQENIQKKAHIQYELLSQSFERLAPGGVLIYSTCTFAPEENEGVLAQFLSKTPEASLENAELSFLEGYPWYTKDTPILPEAAAELFDTIWLQPFFETQAVFRGKCIRILASRETEGFFLAKIRKN